MIKINQVNKFFNRRKKNEIHVINNTTLTMEKSGLVALLGPSGCGKTTLLNVVGGLDKVNTGSIFINGQRITARSSGAIDKIRNLNIGYIFQNYNLVSNMTVFDNVAIALKMVGVKDKKEIEEKVNYVLEKVGMYRYRNRHADMLSGGEQQRVGIARALVKNPAIVIADEPTGNLDSRNTIEIMNIIKSISMDKLVVMVTHEEELAQFYASRIIRIKDGAVISDQLNEDAGGLNYRLDNKIYLKDIQNHKRLDANGYKVDFYNETGGALDIDIVIRNENIYIRTKDSNSTVNVVDDESAIEFVDDHYREMTKEEALNNGFDINKLEHKGRRKYKSILNPWTLIQKGFRTVFDYPVLKKILMVGFFVSALFITFSVSSIFGVTNVRDKDFIKEDKSYVDIVDKNVEVSKYQEYENNPNVQYVIPGRSTISLQMKYDSYIQTMFASAPVQGSLSDSGKLTEDKIIAGRLPENSSEIVIDKMVLKDVIEMSDGKSAGLIEPKSFVDKKITVSNMPEFTIVGVSRGGSPCIYADKSIFINLLSNLPAGEGGEGDSLGEAGKGGNYIDYTLKSNDVTIKKGGWPINDYEVVVNEKNKEEMKIGKTIKNKINGEKLKVVGYYNDPYDSDYMLVNNNTIKYNLIRKSKDMTVCPVDKEAFMAEMKEANINAKDIYKEARSDFKKQKKSYVMSMIIVSAIALAIAVIEIYLMIRASFLSRVKEVGVYRAIGVKKSDIYKMFIGEIIAISTIASLPGFLFMWYILKKLVGVEYLQGYFLVTPYVLGIALLAIYALNVVFGLFPVFRTISKRPAQILSRTDIN